MPSIIIIRVSNILKYKIDKFLKKFHLCFNDFNTLSIYLFITYYSK